MTKKKTIDWSWIEEQQKQVTNALKPKIEYFDDLDILNIWFGGENECKCSMESDNGIVFDVDKNDNIIALEIMDFSRFMKKEDVTTPQ